MTKIKSPECAEIRRAIMVKQRKTSALTALGRYLQTGENLDILLGLEGDPETIADKIWRLTPPGTLPKLSRRLRSTGTTRVEFADQVNAVLDLAHDKMIQPPTRRVIITNLWVALREAGKD